MIGLALAFAVGVLLGLPAGGALAPIATAPEVPADLPPALCRELVEARLLKAYVAEHGRLPAVLHYREPYPCR